MEKNKKTVAAALYILKKVPTSDFQPEKIFDETKNCKNLIQPTALRKPFPKKI